MAPPQQSHPAAKPAVRFWTKPGQGEVKVSLVNIRGPFSTEIIRPQTNTPTNSRILLHRPQPSGSYMTSQAASKPVRFSTVSKEAPATMTGSSLNKDSVSRMNGLSPHRLIGPSPGLRPLCLAGVSGSAVKECLIIRSVQPQIQNKTPDGPAAQ